MVVGVEVEFLKGMEFGVRVMKLQYSTTEDQEQKIIQVNYGNTTINRQGMSFLISIEEQRFGQQKYPFRKSLSFGCLGPEIL